MINSGLSILVSRAILNVAVRVVLCLFVAIPAAVALESDWAETEGGRMRLVIDPEPRADGAILGLLDIELDPGWKTYWRDPGSAGIPPTLDFSQSRGVALEAFKYPAPVRVDDGYAVWAGYTSSVRFPLQLRRTMPGAAEVKAMAFIGICEKICVPFQAELSVDLPAESLTSDRSKSMITEAMATLPEAAGQDFGLERASVADDQSRIEIVARLPAFRPGGAAPQLFVAGPEGSAFAQPVLVADEGGQAHWRVDVERLPANAGPLDPATIDAVITLGQRAMGARLMDAGPHGE
ncbi:protein-disulfide reductase DsbD domain-containing protein [uncultured Hoeflea sp.]|uniref:protein-disulfide reductase DsbD domain-containing protein n=1 Tax=uncultured Hoeflea sp. TaxID=538666 RepID=UPI00262ECF95|nr:protein-disulfide reductase DsbD domain-containing protein [uncultured Hoeflea sp.]